jgi:hypothetical protein
MPTELQLACDNLRFDIRKCPISEIEKRNMVRRVTHIERLAAEAAEKEEVKE